MGVSYKTRTKRRNANTRLRRGNRLGFGPIQTKPQLDNPILRKLTEMRPRDTGTQKPQMGPKSKPGTHGTQTGVVNVEGTQGRSQHEIGLPHTTLAWEIRGRHAFQVPATPHHMRVAARVREVLRRSCSPRLKAMVRSLTLGYSVRGTVLRWNAGRACYRWLSLRQAQSTLWAVWGLEPGEVSSVAGWDLG